jgi:tRNA-2-methylthio-N6-dimethylallyladenosine synthase
MGLIERIGYAQAFSFKYSPRPGTPAATMDDQISMVVMDERLQRLQGLLNRQQHAFNHASVGLETSILVERDGKRPGQRIGKSPWLQSVVVETEAVPGTLLDVRIISAGPNSLGGEPMHNIERRHVA